MSLKPAKLLLTRPEAQSRRFLAALGVNVATVIAPVLRITPHRQIIPARDHALLLFTSENGVAAAATMAELGGRSAMVVGERTRAAARAAGITVLAVAPDAASLIARLTAEPPGGRLLLLRGEHSTGGLAETLSSRGIDTDELVIYRQEDCPLNPAARALLQGPDTVLIPLFSQRSARILAGQIGGLDPVAPIWLVAISQGVAAAWQGPAPLCIEIAPSPDGAGMIEVIRRAFRL